jgi:hypothetical protein
MHRSVQHGVIKAVEDASRNKGHPIEYALGCTFTHSCVRDLFNISGKMISSFENKNKF